MSTAKSVTKSKGRNSGPHTEEVVEALRSRIVNQELPPGSKLREMAVTKEFGISRVRVREALGVLEDRGLIERIPNSGAVVTRLEVEKVYELFQVREVLEGLAVRLATINSKPEDWGELLELFHGPAEDAVETGDLDFYVACINRFRDQCITLAENSVLTGQLDAIYDRTRVLIRRLVLVPGRAQQGLSQHREILRAMKEGDAERAEDLKRKNIRDAGQCFTQYQKYLL